MHRILLPTDAFPPRCGGAGWSAHALALALLGRGHALTAVALRQGTPGITREDVLGVPTVRFGYRVPNLPIVQNIVRHELLWPQIADLLVGLARASGADTRPPIMHAQHVQVAPAAVMAGRRLRAPVVVTVRDHWPWDYFATGLHGNRVPYAGASYAALATNLIARLGPLRGALALPAVPYMRAHLHRRRMFLSRADAVIAVSSYIAERLRGIVAPERIFVVPNMVDLPSVDRVAAQPPESIPAGERFLLFVGKLERNKGAHLLGDILLEAHRIDPDALAGYSLVVAGDGPLKPVIERACAAAGIQVRLLDWVEHDEVLRLMAHCGLLLFPSTWGEPLSRVLLEACACGAPILAMPTGGTPDLLDDNRNAAIERTVSGFTARLIRLIKRPHERDEIGAAAHATAERRLTYDIVVPQIEAVYRKLASASNAS
jgi:glycosyltransferase involved in cell wall biosynthesis